MSGKDDEFIRSNFPDVKLVRFTSHEEYVNALCESLRPLAQKGLDKHPSLTKENIDTFFHRTRQGFYSNRITHYRVTEDDDKPVLEKEFLYPLDIKIFPDGLGVVAFGGFVTVKYNHNNNKFELWYATFSRDVELRSQPISGDVMTSDMLNRFVEKASCFEVDMLLNQFQILSTN